MTHSHLRGRVTPKQSEGGFTLIELVVSVGLFAFIMTLVSGSYIMMIGLNKQAQGLATGINNLSFAIETMARDIRTGSNYNCAGAGDCTGGASSFSFVNMSGTPMSYAQGTQSGPNGVVGDITMNGSALTDPSVDITALTFYVYGTQRFYPGMTNIDQPHVTITVSGTVSTGAGKTESFTVETGATMRGTDL